MFYLVMNGKVVSRGAVTSLKKMVDEKLYTTTKTTGNHVQFFDRFGNEVAAIHPL